MKGIILAGGSGSRLYPLTKITNKHLLPIYDKPMIYYPLQTLINAGIKDILIVSGTGHAGHFLNLLGSGKELGINLTYEVQEEAKGIGHALSLAENFAGKEKCVVILGDNIFQENVTSHIKKFGKLKEGAIIFLKEVNLTQAKRFGIAEVKNDKVTYVEEKPKNPKSNLAMTGLYMFDNDIFKILRGLSPSRRNEIEITDAIEAYLKKGLLYYSKINDFWSDAGTFDSLLECSKFIKETEK
jgi:glucose-1-phosphate thymidylyltransferase